MPNNNSFNSLYLLIIILIVACLSLISGVAIGLYTTNSAQQTQISENNATCTIISSLPYAINTTGYYCLNENLTVDTHGITINADNVLLDFQGFSINGSREPVNNFYGINADDRSNIHIRNGEITGFFYAININDYAYGQSIFPYKSGSHTIEDMEISYSTFRGIVIRGNGNVIQNNIIRHIQGNILYEDSYAMGIESTGPGALIRDNYIYEIRGRGIDDIGEGVGISLSDHGHGSVIINNIIVNNGLEPSTINDIDGLSRSTWGIWIGGEANVTISYNQISNYAYGIGFRETTTRSLIHNNAITMYYTPINFENADLNETPHTVYNNICDTETCVSSRIFPTREP